MFASVKLFHNCSSSKSYPNLNNIPLRKKTQDRPKRPVTQNKPNKKSEYKCSRVKQQTGKGNYGNNVDEIPSELLNQVVRSNFDYFKNKLVSNNASVPSKYKLKLPSKPSKTLYKSDFRKPLTANNFNQTDRATSKNCSHFDGAIKPKINKTTTYNQEFIEKKAVRSERSQQALTTNQQYPISLITMYQNEYMNWGTKAGNVTLETRPYGKVMNFPFSKEPSTYKLDFKLNQKIDRAGLKENQHLKPTLGPKISNTLKFQPKSSSKAVYAKKKDQYTSNKSNKINRNKFQTLSVCDGSNIGNQSSYKLEFTQKAFNKDTTTGIITVEQLQRLMARLR